MSHSRITWKVVLVCDITTFVLKEDVKLRDVPDIRFRLAGYPAIFCYPVPAKILAGAG